MSFDFFARGLHTRTAVARLPLRQLGFLVQFGYVLISILGQLLVSLLPCCHTAIAYFVCAILSIVGVGE